MIAGIIGTVMDNRFLEASPDCVKVLSPNGDITFINSNGRCLLEVDEQTNFTGRSWADLWPEDNREQVLKSVAAAAAGQSTRFSAFCPTCKGTLKWWDVAVSPLTSPDGKLEAIIATSRDISQMKFVEATLFESEKRFRALADTIPQLAWLADTKGEIVWYNRRWLEYTGQSFEEGRGLGWKSVHHPEHVERVSAKFADALNRGEEWEDVFPLRGANGEYRWFLSRAMPQRDEFGRPVMYCGTNTDITDQRSQNQRLRQLVRIVDMSHEAILIRDLDDGIVSWNRGCVELYGFSKAEAVGQSSHTLLNTRHPVPSPAEFDKLLLMEGMWSGELLHQAKDGSQVWVESRQEVIRFGGRKLVLETNRDITERRRADEYRNLLVAELNHRVKNTLAIVQSLATQTARTATSVPQFVTSFDGRLHALASAHTILSDSNWAGASLVDLVKALVALHGEHAARVSIAGEDVYLSPQTALNFTLILHELITNAIRHGALGDANGHVAITWTVRSDSDQRALEFEWRETGGPPVPATRGTGFGMALIERSNRLPNIKARISFEPQGLVAVISAILNAAEMPVPELFNPGKLLTAHSANAATKRRSQLVRDRILIFESEPNDALLLEDMLYDAGFVTLGPVSTVVEAERKLGNFAADLAVIDADGSLCEIESVIAAASARGVPCILIGSIRRLSERTHIDPAMPRLTKPLRLQQLVTAIATAIAVARSSPPPAAATSNDSSSSATA